LRNNPLTVVDLFSGAGGLGEGFYQAGCDIITSIDNDQYACSTLRTRELYRLFKSDPSILQFYYAYLKGFIDYTDLYNMFPELKSYLDSKVRNIELNKETYKAEVGYINKLLYQNGYNNELDVVVGGPPCQAYSIIGRSRDPERKLQDPRHYLYKIYLNIIEKLKPRMFVYENVPGLLSANTNNGRIIKLFNNDFNSLNPSYIIIPQNTSELKLFNNGFSNLKDYLINASEFGIPQIRKRVILVGVREDIYKNNSQQLQMFWKYLFLNKVKKQTSVHDAIGDLPKITVGLGNDRYFSDKYRKARPSKYSKMLRDNSIGVFNHKARTHLKSDLERYQYLIDISLREKRHASLLDIISNRPDLVPKHKNLNSFLDRFKVQLPDKPGSTVTAHISRDGHYYIHPDPEQCRSFTVREAARIQSFPDDYFFEGSRTQQFRQVGNAVPPILSNVIARAVQLVLAMSKR